MLAATKASVSDESKEISNRIAAWEFQYSLEESRNLKKAIELAIQFLKEYAELFPNRYIPQSIPQLSAFAIRIHVEFMGLSLEAARKGSSELVSTIVQKY